MIEEVSIILVLAVMGSSVSAEDSTGNIFNGDNVEKFEWPWVVWISYTDFTDDYDEDAPRCTGSLISDRWVLTSAECFRGTNGAIGVPRSGRMPFVGLGDFDITSTGDREQVVEAEDVIFSFPSSRFYNDMALIKLSEPAKLHKRSIEVVPRLGTASLLNKTKEKESMCYSIGWGAERTNEGGWRFPSKLQKLRVTINDDVEYCTRYFYGLNNYKHICASATKERAARCFYGDKGSPMMCYTNRKWTQVGVFSTQFVYDGCMGGLSLDTDVSYFRRWIRQTMRLWM